MKRQGSCNQCGACCKWAGWFSTQGTQEFIDHLRTRDRDICIRVIEGANDDGILLFDVLVPHQCGHLHCDDGKHACDLEGEDKPELCKAYPLEGDELEPGCGFRFEES